MSRLFLGGIPTAPDVKLLREKLGELVLGREISHADIEGILGAKRTSNRYRSVIGAWRKECLRQHNIEIGSVVGVGYRVLNGSERLTTNYDGFRAGARKQARHVRRVTMIRSEELSQPELAKRDHMQRIGAVILDQTAQLSRLVEPPKPKPQEQIASLKREAA